MTPTTVADPDPPITEPLAIGPVRGLWNTRDPDVTILTVLFASMTAGLMVVWFLKHWIDSRWGERTSAVVATALATATFAGLIVFIFRPSVWGDASWRVDDRGVSFIPPKREPTFLAWDDVEQVRLLAGSTLRGRGIQVRFPPTLPEADRREVARRIRERLGDDFDLRARQYPQASIESFLRLLAIALVATAAFFATTLGPIFAQAFGGPRIAWIGPTVFLCWMLLSVAGAAKLMRRTKAELWIPRRSSVDVAKEAKPEIRP